MSDHLARHVLERVHAADPRARVNPVAHVHLTECDRCAVRKRALEVAHARFFAAHPVDAFAREVLALAAQPEPQPSRLARLRRGVRKLWPFKQSGLIQEGSTAKAPETPRFKTRL